MCAVGNPFGGSGASLEPMLQASAVDPTRDAEVRSSLPLNNPKVPSRKLGIDATLALPVVEVTSFESDGTYGVGSEITIDIR